MRYFFDDCVLDLDRRELLVGGVPRPIEPQVFDVLSVLVRHHERVVPKNELVEQVWSHGYVTESSVTSRIKSARRSIGDDGHEQRLIRTVHGRGYQFIGEVRAESTPDHPAPRSRATPVPHPATRTVGRAHDVERVHDLLSRARIVTLLGPGGVGKTRLAIEVALAAAEEACFVDLTIVRDPRHVAGLIARELGIHSGSGRSRRQLEEAVRGSSRLVVLDNFEHVIEAAEIVTDMVRWSADLRVLATSRARLRVLGEHVYDVAPLSVEATGSSAPADAVTLFNQAATAVDPGFRLDSNLADVVAICRTLDGLPLAVELAAGHVRTLPPTLLRLRLGRQLGSSAVTARDLPSRQQTIPAMIDWSLQLVGDTERRLFAQLGVFAGPVPLDAIEQACVLPGRENVLESLSRLVDQSMVRRVSDLAGEPRFVLLELLRERARELLAGSDDAVPVAARHAAYVAAVCDDVNERKWTDLSDRWIDILGGLLPEIRSAYAWAYGPGGDTRVGARITAGMGTYWHREGHHREGREWVVRALNDAEALEPSVVARLHLAGGFVEWTRDQLAARAHWERAISAFRALADDRYLAYALALTAGTYIGDRGHYEFALQLCEEGIGLARRVAEKPLIAQTLNVKGELTRVHGDDRLAMQAYEEGRDLATAARDRAHQCVFLANLGYLAEHRGNHAEALRLGQESLRLCWSLGRRMMAAWSVSELAGPELAMGRPERGARMVGAADEALRVLGAARHPGDISEHARVVDGLRARLGSREFHRLCAEGARLSLDDAVALALAAPDATPSVQAPRRDYEVLG